MSTERTRISFLWKDLQKKAILDLILELITKRLAAYYEGIVPRQGYSSFDASAQRCAGQHFSQQGAAAGLESAAGRFDGAKVRRKVISRKRQGDADQKQLSDGLEETARLFQKDRGFLTATWVLLRR